MNTGVFNKTFYVDDHCQHHQFCIVALFFTATIFCQLATRFAALKISVGKVVQYNPVLQIEEFIGGSG